MSPLESALAAGEARRPSPLVGAIPFVQAICIALALALIERAPPVLGAVAWLLGAIAVPLLWALFFVEYKKREVASDRYRQEARRKRLNHVLLLIGLAVGMWGAFVFATEVAK